MFSRVIIPLLCLMPCSSCFQNFFRYEVSISLGLFSVVCLKSDLHFNLWIPLDFALVLVLATLHPAVNMVSWCWGDMAWWKLMEDCQDPVRNGVRMPTEIMTLTLIPTMFCAMWQRPQLWPGKGYICNNQYLCSGKILNWTSRDVLKSKRNGFCYDDKFGQDKQVADKIWDVCFLLIGAWCRWWPPCLDIVRI